MALGNFLFDVLAGDGARGRLSIVLYHRVHEVADPMFAGEPDARAFDSLVRHVKRRFNVLPLAEAIDRLRAGSLPTRALAITFDDGYADNASVAAPILHRHGVPATVFVATRYLDGGCMWNDVVIESCRSSTKRELDLSPLGLPSAPLDGIDARRALADDLLGKLKYREVDERDNLARKIAAAAGVAIPTSLMMSRDAVRSLAGFGIAVGAHTLRHPILAVTPPQVAWQEISESGRELAQLVRAPIALFAYPNGKPGRDYTSEHVRMVRDAGYAAAVSTAAGASSRESDVHQLPRYTPWRNSPLRFDALMAQNLRRAAVAPAS